MHENISFVIELLGLVSFSMSGAFAAMEKKLDPFGVIIVSFVTSFGGGTLRDVLLDVPVFWMKDLFGCSVVLFASIFAIVLKSFEKKFQGIQKGIDAGQGMMISLTLGMITGCFGGMFRDIFLNRIPLVLRKEIYATACILGGILFLILTKYTSLPYVVVHISTILVIVVIRTLAVKYEWQMPNIYTNDENKEKS